MRWFVAIASTALVFFLPISNIFGQGAKTGMAVWDTGRPAPAVLPLAKNDWMPIAAERLADGFKGDAVLSNGRIAAVLRLKDAAVEVHAVKGAGTVERLRLRLQSSTGEPAVSVERMALIENSKSGATLQATFKTAKGAEVVGKFRIKRGDVAVQIDPGVGAGKLRVECPGRFVVLPDFFADDITLDAVKLPLATVDLPSENFLLHLTGNNDAIGMCVFENRQQDVKVTLSGKGANRIVTGSEIGFEKKKIWVAVMEAPRIWYGCEVAAADAGKTYDLGWKMPFPAQWRVDFSKANDLTDSWEMLLQERGYLSYVKPSWMGRGDENIAANRERWNTVLGTFSYPAWSDPDGRGFLQPIDSKKLKFTGPALIYPIHRVAATPQDAFTVVDVMRNTLGVGPCEHLLDLEGQKEEYRGQATCGVRDTLTPIYANKQQKERMAEVDKTLDDGLIFVRHIRGRIENYIAFGKKTRKYLAEQKKARPELAEFIAEMDKLTAEIDKRVAARADKIRSPDDVVKMNADFRKNVLGYEGPDAIQRCKAYTHALWLIGDNQDELSGELRWAVRTLRQRAGILMALDPRVTPVAMEIRNRTQEVLRNAAWHEGSRH